MKKQVIVIGAMLAAGAAVAAVIIGMPSTSGPPTESEASGRGEPTLEARVLALETALSAEREARQLIEDELFVLYEVIESLEAGSEAPPAAAETGRVEIPGRDNPAGRLGDGWPTAGRDDIERRRAALTAAGFPADRADWILKRESELRMQAMQARFEQMQSGEPPGPADRLRTPDSQLRREIGDTQYERYLEATNRPTSVNVRQVLATSPASSAGLQPGDRITHYDGERVFTTSDLTRQALAGRFGENVVVDIVRDGVPMQVVMPRGPLGISARRVR